MSQSDEKRKEILRELAAQFFSKESNRQSLITVTGVEITGRGSQATILMTVLPEDKEEAALDFAHRQLTDFKKFVMDNSRIARIPFFNVKIDKGEKNRQRIDEIQNSISTS
jgi:ribosome-binding factor A